MTVTEFDGIRVFFHVGTGKTGTSSIQATLRDQREQLLAKGVLYLGLVLEYAPLQKYPWQRFGATPQLHRMPLDTASSQIEDIILGTMDYARSNGVHTIVWSSESFFDRPEKALPVLRRIAERGANVRPIVYVRRNDAWASSAFVQWGIKHKTQPGPVRPFRVWIKKRPPMFYPGIQRFRKDFGANVIVRNFDTKHDVVADFLAVCGIPLEAPEVPPGVNQTGSAGEILLRALFNAQFAQPVLPREFNRIVAPRIEFDQIAADHARKLLPTSHQLERVVREAEEDRRIVNEYLQREGVPELVCAFAPAKGRGDEPPAISSDALLFYMAAIATRQSARVGELERRLAALQSK